MLYILACIVLASGFIVLAELLTRMADRIGLSDKLFRLFDLPEDDPKSNVIYVDFKKEEREMRHG